MGAFTYASGSYSTALGKYNV
ncbi:TPA: hypothetical protein DCZ39_07865 [Patescibacteria group bacterium]|nr:hypothetical protein [Candidatus Gracilibacteria bacterium]